MINNQKSKINTLTSVGVVGYGAYVPHHFIESREIDERASQLGLSKKALAAWDEDSVTMAVEAGYLAMQHSGVDATHIGAVYVGSESPAYAVNPSSTIVADVLGICGHYQAVDMQFACKAATAGLSMMAGQIAGNGLKYGLVIGSDKSQARPGDVLEWSAGAAAAALLLGRERVIAEVVASASFSSDTPDFWRREQQAHPSHGGRFTGEPAYFTHVMAATKAVLTKTGLQPGDFSQAVFHMPNGKFPLQVAGRLGFLPDQITTGLTVREVGNPYSASSLLGLVAVLEQAQPDDLVLMTSYGSGAGSDSFVFRVTEAITDYPRGFLRAMMQQRKQMDLGSYRQEERWR